MMDASYVANEWLGFPKLYWPRDWY
ncbi:unnamed protein product [Spirodela intermedia]|uniref:Uncharacterized protein n=1 Tax=Spirodela intermedia TaxID=51605 RepID=A0A7I8LLJ2_SPIIN|nr:unnamed protein product [Spirodela intermedia]